MKKLKLGIRILIAVVLFVPSAPIIWMAFSMIGIAVGMTIVTGIIFISYGWLYNDFDSIEEGKDALKMFCFIIASPFMFWWEFINSRNPFEL